MNRNSIFVITIGLVIVLCAFSWITAEIGTGITKATKTEISPRLIQSSVSPDRRWICEVVDIDSNIYNTIVIVGIRSVSSRTPEGNVYMADKDSSDPIPEIHWSSPTTVSVSGVLWNKELIGHLKDDNIQNWSVSTISEQDG